MGGRRMSREVATPTVDECIACEIIPVICVGGDKVFVSLAPLMLGTNGTRNV